MTYDRQELVCIGERFPTDALVEWAEALVQSARVDASRLAKRGITEETLQHIEDSVATVRICANAAGRDVTPDSPQAQRRREILRAAEDWRREVQGMALAVFDTEPNLQAAFRPGVRVSRSLPKLTAETVRLLEALREHSAELRHVGADADFFGRGEEIVQRLEECRRGMREEFDGTPETLIFLNHARGVLYTQTRYLARIAWVEFDAEEVRLRGYSYDLIRKGIENARLAPMAAGAR